MSSAKLERRPTTFSPDEGQTTGIVNLCKNKENCVKFGHEVFEICERTNRHAQRRIRALRGRRPIYFVGPITHKPSKFVIWSKMRRLQ